MKRITILLLTFIFLITFMLTNLNITTSATISHSEQKRFLILHSYSRDYLWTEYFHNSIVDSLNDYYGLPIIRTEYMDTKNYLSDEGIEILYDLYSEKYADLDFDLIIATDNTALNFLTKYKESLFADTPVVATGINFIASVTAPDDFYLIEETLDYESTIHLALDEFPNAENLYFIIDSTVTGTLIEESIKSCSEIDCTHNHTITFIRDLEDPATKDLIKSLDDNDLLFFLFYFKGANGESYHSHEMSKVVASLANIPVYTFWYYAIGNGLLGGNVITSTEYGRIAVEKSIDILNGNPGDSIIYDNGNSKKYAYDYNVAKKYNMTKFPSNSIIINKPISFYEQYKPILRVFTIVILILTIIILLLLRLLKNKMELSKKNTQIIELNHELMDTQGQLINTLGDVIETKSSGTGQHVKRVAKISKCLAIAYGLPEKDVQLLEIISPMHDVGKIGISEMILLKPGKLTKSEYAIMKLHTDIGYDILKYGDQKLMKMASIIAYQHHEHWDGAGYPNGLKGDEIHIFARITSIADVYDALRNVRPYKLAWSKESVVDYFIEQNGKMFDPDLIKLFLEHVNDFEQILVDYAQLEPNKIYNKKVNESDESDNEPN